MSELPTGWAQTTLGDLGEWRGGGTPSKQNSSFWTNGYIPWVSPKDMKRDLIDNSEDRITATAVEDSATQLIPPHSVLVVTRSGILRHTLPIAVNTREVTVNQDLKALSPAYGIDASFIAAELRAEAQAILAECAKSGTTVDSVDFKRLKAFRFKLAPSAEQRRVVVKLDTLFGATGRARIELDRIPTLIARYKQAIQSAAFSGDLTRDWRRKERLEGEWSSRTVGSLVKNIVAGKNLRCEERPPRRDERGVLKVSAVTWGEFDPQAAKTLPVTFDPSEKTRVHSGDLLISRANTLELVGSLVIVQDTPSNLFLSDKVLRLEVDDEYKGWLLWFLRSPAGRGQIERSATGNQVSMRNLSQAALSSISVPWPTSSERQEIVRRIETAFAWLERVALEHGSASRLLSRLDQTILTKAFRGELVPQDPNDEPASVLLERIRAARETATKPKRGRRKQGERRPSTVITVKTPKEQLQEELESWPERGLSFEEIATRISGDYEDVRGAIFDLLAGPAPVLMQEFDARDRLMRIRKAAA